MNTQNPMPSMVKAKEIAKVIPQLFNGNILLINSVVPLVNETGLIINKDTQKKAQQEFNNQGLLVVKGNGIIPEGINIALRPHTTPLLTKVISSKDLIEGLDADTKKAIIERTGKYAQFDDRTMKGYYKKYVLMVVHPTDIVCQVDFDES